MKLNQKTRRCLPNVRGSLLFGSGTTFSNLGRQNVSDKVVLQSQLVAHQDMAHLLEQIYRVDDKSAEIHIKRGAYNNPCAPEVET